MRRLYKKASILLNDLGSDEAVQANFFDTVDRVRSKKLMAAVDEINGDIGSCAIQYGAVGLSCDQSWKTAFNSKRQSNRIYFLVSRRSM